MLEIGDIRQHFSSVLDLHTLAELNFLEKFQPKKYKTFTKSLYFRWLK